MSSCRCSWCSECSERLKRKREKQSENPRPKSKKYPAKTNKVWRDRVESLKRQIEKVEGYIAYAEKTGQLDGFWKERQSRLQIRLEKIKREAKNHAGTDEP